MITSGSISIGEYNKLIAIKTKYEALINCILNNSIGLGYGNKFFEIDSKQLNFVVKSLEPEKYNQTMQELIKNKNKEER